MIRRITLLLLVATALHAQNLATGSSNLFSGSGVCAQCHGPGAGVFVTKAGEDISPPTMWKSTMMANSARDPLWQAKVSAEVLDNPELTAIIEDKCATCHMPMGRTEALFLGETHYGFDAGAADLLALDGVSCTLCHQIHRDNLGAAESFTGGYEIRNLREIYGPYTAPMTAPMFNRTGYNPVYSDHVNESELCATCHTLYTPYVDNAGQVAGYLPEQTPYLEWQNSDYPQAGKSCQTCHMPADPESMKISTSPARLTTLRTPIYRHEFVGGNTLLMGILRDNAVEIGAAATVGEFDTTVSRLMDQLRNRTVDLRVTAAIEDDALRVSVLVANLAGHKFPSGFPSRRAWLHLRVNSASGAVVFESGAWDGDSQIIGIDPRYEPHYDEITRTDQVQIYQSVMHDVDGEVTYTLLRGAGYAKDNRLPPKGFKTTAVGYPDVAVSGTAPDDPNFNKDIFGREGSGTDSVVYRIPLGEGSAPFSVSVEMCYQTVSPEFADDLFSHASPEVETFQRYYRSADTAPVIVAQAAVTVSRP